MDKLEYLQKLKLKSLEGSGKDAVEKQHSKGKLTARERINKLLDKDSFIEFDRFVLHHCTNFGMENKQFLGDGVITGLGKIDGRQVYIYAHDFTVLGGSLGISFAQKICKILDLAMKNGKPVIALCDSGGARIQEGIISLAGYSEIFYRNAKASGVIPQISAILGSCAGGSVYSPSLTDFTFMVDEISHMFITGPDVVKAVMSEEVTFEELGGAKVHNKISGVSHFISKTEDECFFQIRKLLSYLPSNNLEDSPEIKYNIDKDLSFLNTIVPEKASKPYNMYDVINAVMDDESFFEVHAEYAKNLIVGFARLNGKSIGIVANQPNTLAGCLDSKSSVKGARFVRFCDAFNIPVITFVDVPGFLPGKEQEHNAIITHGAKLIYAYAEASVPKLTVITRKAYGGAYCVMSCKHFEGDLNLAWHTAEIAVMGAEGAANIIFRKELQKDPDKKDEIIESYKEKFASPYVAAEYGYIDDVIEPSETRIRLIQGLEMTRSKRMDKPKRKHGNIPL